MATNEITTGQLWHWQFNEKNSFAEYRFIIYNAQTFLYLFGTKLMAEDIKARHKIDAAIAKLSEAFSGDDKEVDNILRVNSLNATKIPHAALIQVELLPLFDNILRIKWNIQQKNESYDLKFGGAMSARTLFDELREAISPLAPIKEQAMDLKTAIFGPVIATLMTALFGPLLIWLVLDIDENPRSHVPFFIGLLYLLGPWTIAIITIIGLGLGLFMVYTRANDRPRITLWKPNGDK